MALNSTVISSVFMGYREDGRIIGVTEALAAQDIYELGEKVDPFILAEGTRMGHDPSIG